MGAEKDAGEEKEDLQTPTTREQSLPIAGNHDTTELDDFGLPKKEAHRVPPRSRSDASSLKDKADADADTFHDAEDGQSLQETALHNGSEEGIVEEAKMETEVAHEPTIQTPLQASPTAGAPEACADDAVQQSKSRRSVSQNHPNVESSEQDNTTPPLEPPSGAPMVRTPSRTFTEILADPRPSTPPLEVENTEEPKSKKKKKRRSTAPEVSEWSHQRLAPKDDSESENGDESDEWQAMPAVTEYDIYDDYGRIIAKGAPPEDEEKAAYGGLGGAGKGYTKVQLDEDAQSATSMDDDTGYLFKGRKTNEVFAEDEEEQRDALSQLEATKDLLTEQQRIAYVGVTRLALYNMTQELENMESTKVVKKNLVRAQESMQKWGQLMMVRLHAHMDIDSAEQLMIEQLAEHGVQPVDLAPPLMKNARVKNPMAEDGDSARTGDLKSPEINGRASTSNRSIDAEKHPQSTALQDATNGQEVPEVHTPSQMEHTKTIDLDLRWTVLCDLFLTLIADSVYDSRSRRLLEEVAKTMEISWVQICRFEKRVIDALEMQEEKDRENWNEEDHVENRRKMGLRRKYVFMGLATVGGGLVIGLSAGLLAPVIGAGLAAGFTTIGVSGTAGFLGGVGGAALITSAATAAGGTIAVRASHRRTGAVKTFEYRPLHNNKRLNLILTVSGWMNGKVDDVRLPFSTIDPIMGDIYSLHWEPEMLQSMGDTINILATEALTQTVQQVLGSTILVALMASLQLPIVLSKLSYLIDNPWTVSLDRANSAGLILADSLIDRHLGNRPITLLGFSLGARLIFSCLKELAARGAYGMIQNVYLFGSPVVAKEEEYLKARTVVSGRFVNGYASNDWILGYLFRATSGGIMRVAGLAPVENIPGLENIDVTGLVNGHMAYRTAMPKLLREVGWEVESDEFTEIEDPDPENHAKRQRELIREIDEARKEAEIKPGKRRFGFFKKGKLAQKKGWETYDEKSSERKSSVDGKGGSGDDGFGNGTILFDVEAIKRELASEMMEVREVESTLPPMQLNLNGSGQLEALRTPSPSAKSPRSTLRQTQSSDANLASQPQTHLQLPDRSYSNSRNSSPQPSVGESDCDFAVPRELQSTLPPLRLSSESRSPFAALASPMGERQEQPYSQLTASISNDASISKRPELKSAATMPLPGSASPPLELGPDAKGGLNVEHNAWADEDDPEDWDKEREVTMTF